jgi:Predicted Rossmann fold nucleotide-binding protein
VADAVLKMAVKWPEWFPASWWNKTGIILDWQSWSR